MNRNILLSKNLSIGLIIKYKFFNFMDSFLNNINTLLKIYILYYFFFINLIKNINTLLKI